MKIKIFNLNFFGLPLFFNKEIRYRFLLQKIKKLSPDLIFLQEIIFRKDVQKLASSLEERGYKTYFKLGRVFNRGGLFIGSRLKVIQADFVPFTDQGPIFSSAFFERLIIKGFLYIEIREFKKEFFLATSHLCYYEHFYLKHQKEPLTSLAQTKQIIAFFKNKKNVIIGGDFNFLPEARSYALMKDKGRYKEVSKGRIKTLSPENFNRQKFLKLGITHLKPITFDYIFYKGGIKRIKAKRIADKPFVFQKKSYYLSDHYGIEAVLEI